MNSKERKPTQAAQAATTYFGEQPAQPTATGLLDAIDRALANYPAPPPAPKDEPHHSQVNWAPILKLALTGEQRTALRKYVKTIDGLETKLAAAARGQGKVRTLRAMEAAVADPTPENLEAVGKAKAQAEFELLQQRHAIKGTLRQVKREFATGPGLEIARKASELAAGLVANLAESEAEAAKMFGVNFRESPTLKAICDAAEYLANAVREGAPCFDLVRSLIPPEELKAAIGQA
ncbi:MAG: hypothetical protein JXQ71_13865 [Verrucomicrobia bacterium]|nr:hypothetical protein [Verrucomicrobiota bacterium]